MTTPGLESHIIIDTAYLQSIICNIEPSKSCEIITWRYVPLGKNKEESSVFRVSYTFISNRDKKEHSLILKILKPDSRRNQINHYYYWKREALVYQSGLLNQLPSGIRAPKCYVVEEKSHGDVWIWLEDINIETMQCDWSFNQMGKVSYLLGKFNGSYLSGNSLPTETFLCNTWLRSWIKVCTSYAKPVQEQKVLWDCYIKELDIINATADYIWNCYSCSISRLRSLLETLNVLPRVFAHQDVHWDNIFIEQLEDRDSLVAIDWQFASISGVGEELGRIFGYALLKNKVPVNKVEQYKVALFQSYLQGLRDSGWNGDAKLARFGFCLAAGSRFIMTFDKLITGLKAGHGKSQKEKLIHLLLVAQALLDMVEESWDIKSQIN